MSRTEHLLELILEEMRGIRTDIAEVQAVLPLYRPTYDPDEVYSEITAVKDAVGDLGERITGPLGYHLGDLHSQASDILHQATMIEINTTP